MNTVRLIGMLLFLAGCDNPILNKNHSPFIQLNNGNYIYDFKYTDGCTGDYIKLCALESINQRNLVPIGCKDMEVIKAGKGESGWAWAELRCKTE